MRNFLLSLLIVCGVLIPAVASARTLTVGMSGSDVAAVQKQLAAKGYFSAPSSGYFGSITLVAVQNFQCTLKIACAGQAGYGTVGPATAAVLSAPAQPATLNGRTTAAATGSFEVSGWMPDWRAASGTIDVLPHLNQLRSVMPFGYTVSSQGRIVDHARIGQEPWVSFIAAAHAAHVRVVPTVEWGSGAQIQDVLSDSTSRIALENSIASLVRQRGFDGIDIDFEAKEAQTINYFSTFLKGLYQRMGQKWVYCTVEARMPIEDRYLPGQSVPGDATLYANNYIAMNSYCDRVEIMAYDQSTIDLRLNAARAAPYAPVADPGWVEDIIALAAQTISRNKLIVGIPTYGYEYTVTPQGDGTFKYQRDFAFNPPYALNLAAQNNVSPVRTSAGELGFVYRPPAGNSASAVGPAFADITQQQSQSEPTTTVVQNQDGTTVNVTPFNYVTWSDAQAIQDKIALAKRLGVRGVALFSLGGAEDPAMWSVLP
ncbi:MAG: peptidoglycan-binding protein [Patescibacteria group bacterium]|nr:peptidoglycan-binding protein [Patescibacteria group bacterium]